MKFLFNYIAVIAICTAVVSCKKDNYDAPQSRLEGKLAYQGEGIGVEQYQVPFQLYQYGFGKVGSINSSFAQDGSYSTLLFDGEYKLIIPNGQGPFKWKKTAAGDPDTMVISVRGSQTLDIEVTPYYMIRTPQITAAGGKVTATFKAEKIVTDATGRDIESVNLYVNKTQFVSSSGNSNLANSGMGGGSITDPNNITLSVDIPNISPTQNYVFARIGLKIQGIEDRIYSPVMKLSF